MSVKRYARVEHNSRPLFVEVRGDEGHVLKTLFPADGSQPAATQEVIPLSETRRLAPLQPSKVVAVAVNYRLHALEMGRELPPEPLFFLKPSTTVIGPGDTIVLPPDSEEVHHEAELGLVMGKRLSCASVEEAKEALFGVVPANDVTARDLQRSIKHFTRSKGYDTFCPLGPEIVSGLNPDELQLKCRVNGELRQDGNSSDMVFGSYQLLSFVSQVMTLLPGDVVITGTPAGVGPIRDGNVVEVEIEGVGVLSNPVRNRKRS